MKNVLLAVTLLVGCALGQSTDQYLGWNIAPGCQNPGQVGLCVHPDGSLQVVVSSLNNGKPFDPPNLAGVANFKLTFDSVQMLPNGSAPTVVNVGSANDQHYVLSLPAAKDGAPGAPGATGQTGLTGATGAQGVKGDKGDPGTPASAMTGCSSWKVTAVNPDGTYQVAVSGCK